MSSDNNSKMASDSKYSHHPSTTMDSLVTTIILNLVLFGVWMFIFERYRTYKQIYIKRLQPRFEDISRVPPEPPKSLFGWFFAINAISELDVLRMVGLDAYMLLRYHVVCYKLALFLSFWGLLLLVPLYSTVAADSAWDRYTLSNVLAGEDSYKFRLWAAAIFGYVFSAYFCQLLYAEYSNFSIRRLQYLVQVDPDSPQTDPDTPPQKYFTVMVENIPSHLRSAQALEQFFDKLFPGEVYCVEVTLDLRELNAINYERKGIRDKLEKAIAFYEATNERPETLIQPYGWPSIFGEHIERDPAEELTIQEFSYECIRTLLLSWIDPKEWGYVPVDALSYFTKKLIELNDKVIELQQIKYEEISNADKELERKLRSKYDTRVAAAIQSAAKKAAEALGTKPGKKTSLESILFGPPVQDYNKAAVNVMKKVEHQVHQLHQSPEIEKRRNSQKVINEQTSVGGPTEGNADATPEKRVTAADIFANDINTPLSPKSWMRAQALEEQEAVKESSAKIETAEEGEGDDGVIERPSSFKNLFGEVDEDQRQEKRGGDAVLDVIQEDAQIGDGDGDGDANINFSQDSTFREWAKSANIDLESEHKAVVEESRKRSQSNAPLPLPLPPFSTVANDDENVDTRTRMVSWDARSSVASVDDDDINSNEKEQKGGGQGTSDQPSFELPPIWSEKKSRRGSVSNDDDFMTIPINVNDMVSEETMEQASKLAKIGLEKAKSATRLAWQQTNVAGSGAWRGVVEMERALEMITLGAYYKFSSTAFVTFNSRVTESVAHQMLLSHEEMEVNHAPNPHDIIWDNVATPKSQITMRTFITNAGLVVGSIFWSSLVTSVDNFSTAIGLPPSESSFLSVVIMLVLLLLLPFVFDFLARNYEGMKLESEIQNSIMTRYFYYQLVNIYVTVGTGGLNIMDQILLILRNPQTLVDVLGKSIPAVSLFFANVIIVKILSAVPIEMLRPWQIITILLMNGVMDKRTATRRDMRTGAYYPWPMLYGWIYPQIMMVLMIMVTYACIAPLLSPLCALFFVVAYLMYKYQLLYVYINDYQSGGDMWYAVFNRSLISLFFASLTLLGYLSVQLSETYMAGPFFFFLPLPCCILYFWHYCDFKFQKVSKNLSFAFAKELDIRNLERKEAGKPIPHDSFTPICYRQPSLTEKEVYPEPYRKVFHRHHYHHHYHHHYYYYYYYHCTRTRLTTTFVKRFRVPRAEASMGNTAAAEAPSASMSWSSMTRSKRTTMFLKCISTR